MLGNSVFLKILIAVLCVCMLMTVIAVIAKESGSGNTGTKVTTPTESENAGLQETTPTGSTVTAGPDTGGSLVDPEEGKTLIATNATENAQFYYQLNDSTGEIRYLFGIESGMKANTKYRLEWSISDSINSVYYGIQLMYQIPGLEYPHGLVGDNLYSNSWEFTTDATAEQYLYFYVAQGDFDADSMDAEMLSMAVKQCVVFSLYEVTDEA